MDVAALERRLLIKMGQLETRISSLEWSRVSMELSAGTGLPDSGKPSEPSPDASQSTEDTREPTT